MWQWIAAILIINIIAGIVYSIKNPPQPLKSPFTLLYVLFWFPFVLLDYKIDKQSREVYQRLKLAGIGNAIPDECKTAPQPSSKCAGCNRSFCPNRS